MKISYTFKGKRRTVNVKESRVPGVVATLAMAHAKNITTLLV